MAPHKSQEWFHSQAPWHHNFFDDTHAIIFSLPLLPWTKKALQTLLQLTVGNDSV